MNERFWDYVCRAIPVVRIGIVLDLFLGVLLLYSLPAQSPDEPTYYVAGFAGVTILISLAGFLGIYWKCRRRARSRENN